MRSSSGTSHSMAKADKKKAQHSAAKPDYGTTEAIVESARVVFGGPIDYDPCTSEIFNLVVQARTIYTRKTNGLIHPWIGNGIVNPPGEDHGQAVKAFWEKLIAEYYCRNTKAAIWVGFNIEHLQHLQRTRVDANPFMFPTCIPFKRIPFNESTRDHQASLFGDDKPKLVATSRPAHANFITLLPDRDKPWQTEIFRREFSKHGQVKI